MAIVETDNGAVEGVTLEGAIQRFMNVPYAAPPVGHCRFIPPLEHDPWSGIWDSTRPGPTSPQHESWSPLHAYGAEPGWIPGTGFLNLNIWTPSTEGKHPVGVYVHGGGFREGNGALRMYDGARFAQHGIVLVTINYRVGAEGFALLEGGHRNLGFEDQLAALRWVRRNITRFGGDPERVTVFGQSAGGASVAHLVARPDAGGLFHAAINQSGPVGRYVHDDAALEFTHRVAEGLGVAPTVEGMRDVSPAELVRETETVLGDISRIRGGTPGVGLGPVYDPARLPWHATHDLADAFPHRVPVIGGFTAEEDLLFSWQSDRSILPRDVAIDALASLTSNPEDAIARLRARDPRISWHDIARKVAEHATFVGPLLDWLRAARSLGVSAWGYEFGWPTRAYAGAPGAYHVLDIPFVFDNLDRTFAVQMTGPGAPQRLADDMHGEWVRFMMTGGLDRPPFTDVASLRWFDTATRRDRCNTTDILDNIARQHADKMD